MAIKTIITCDVCGEQKKESNHWFVVYGESDFLAIPWERAPRDSKGKHVCSRNCAQQLFEGWMEKAA